MSTLHIQRYLLDCDKQGVELEDIAIKLEKDYAISMKQSVKYPNLYLFKYDQIESQMGLAIVQECRGLILDSSKEWKIVAFPFTKFFNYGEGHAAKINWDTARVQEKLDGSLMTVYWYDGQWNVATSGNPDAAGEVNGCGFTFNELFWKTWYAQKLPVDMLDHGITYMFELTSPFNRVVVPHREAKLSLIGVRVLEYPSGENSETEDVEDCARFYPELNPVREFELNSFENILKSFEAIDGLRQEGYVVVDAEFRRVKVKHPQYVALHHLKDSMGGGNKSMVRIVVANEGSEFLTYFPEFKEMYDNVKDRFDKFIDGLDEVYDILYDAANGNKGKVNRKEFALQATKTRLPGYFFARLDGRVTNVRDYIRTMQIDNVMIALNLKEA
jgi:T4 RnlA family RNA ligase